MTLRRYAMRQIVLIVFTMTALVQVACKPGHRNATSSESVATTGAVFGGVQGGSDGAVTQIVSAWQTPLNLVDIFANSQDSTRVDLIGEVERITLDRPEDVWSSGSMIVAGMNVVVPANLVIQLPVQRYTLQELHTQARPECREKRQTGLASADDCFFERRGAIATILANRSSSGVVIAGEVRLAKADDFTTGVVTFVNHESGYVVLNGNSNSDSGGVTVRINDPLGRHTIQSGKGCGGGINCSPDVRFPVDSDNYTAAFVTGYPLCIPSTVRTRSRDLQGVNTLSFRNGIVSGNDPNCPFAARTADPLSQPVPDSSRFAPIKIGDSMEATGNFELISGFRFFSAHTVRVHSAPTTSPGRPDYVTIAESRWEVAGFPAGSARSLWVGFTTESLPRLDLFRLAIDPSDNGQHEIPMGSTIANPSTVNIGVPPRNIFRMRFKDVFGIGAGGKLSPCVHLANAEIPACDDLGTLDPTQNFKVMSPISREALVRTRNKKEHPELASFDLNGQPAPNGLYQFPVGIEHPDYLEINLNRVQTPHLFTGEPWNLDRRLGPQGCGGDRGSCAEPASLKPFPFDGGLNPATQVIGLNPVPLAAAGRITSGYPYDDTHNGPALNWASIDADTAPASLDPEPVMFDCSDAK